MLRPLNKAEVEFELLQNIGHEGCNSTVHKAFDRQLGAEIVVKQVPKADFVAVSNFFEESRILYLSSHPNVVQIHYACQDDDSIYIAMPLYANGSLNRLLEKRFLTVREIVVHGCQVASALHHIHSKRLIHFDVKPDNILLSDRGEALLSDFGLSRRMTDSGTAQQDKAYMKMVPPEATEAMEHACTYDLYQLGLTLYRMCNGNAAFHQQFNRYLIGEQFERERFLADVRNGAFPCRNTFLEHIPTRIKRVIKQCLEPDPTKRFQAAIEVANELAQIDDSLDWHYEVLQQGRKWTHKGSEKQIELIIDNQGVASAKKTILSSNRASRITAFCKDNLSAAELKQFFKEQS
jgi:serine/threonine protein kinase